MRKKKKIVFLNETKTKKDMKYMLYWAVRSDWSDRLKTISMQVQICSYWPRIYWYNMVMLYKENKKTYIDDNVAGVFISMI